MSKPQPLLNVPTPPPQLLGDVMARIGVDVAVPLTAALERLDQMASSGRLDRRGLQALRDDVAAARAAGICAQQIARLAGGQVMQPTERVSLSAALCAVLDERAGQPGAMAAAGHRHVASEVEIEADASLVIVILRAAVAWASSHAVQPVSWQVELLPWPVRAQVAAKVTHRLSDDTQPDATLVSGDAQPHLDTLDNLDWLLLRCAAQMAGAELLRHDDPGHSLLTIRFAHPVRLEAPAPAAPPAAPAPLAGNQVLVLAAQREARQRVRDALHGHELFIDHVTSAAEARDYCDDAPPQVLIYEAALSGASLLPLLERLHARPQPVTLIELVPGETEPEPDAVGQTPITRVGLDQLRQRLPALVLRALPR